MTTKKSEQREQMEREMAISSIDRRCNTRLTKEEKEMMGIFSFANVSRSETSVALLD